AAGGGGARRPAHAYAGTGPVHHRADRRRVTVPRRLPALGHRRGAHRDPPPGAGFGMRFASDVSDLELADYQRAVRLVLRHPLIPASYPDDKALPRVRRFSATLRQDLAEAFGYRLELHGSTARLVRTKDLVDPTQPALSRTGRPFDRQRYAYLALCLAVLGRAGIQITLSELAESVAADANRIAGLGLDADRGADRRALRAPRRSP